MSKYKHLVWCDLETTGSDETKDSPLEVGIIVTDSKAQAELGRKCWILRAGPVQIDPMEPYVYAMHKRNGLLDACLQSYWEPHEVDDAAVEFLASVGVPERRGLIAGAGVAHFDRRWIRHWFPRLDAYLAYPAMDTSVVRRFMQAATGKRPPNYKTEDHRAMVDCEAAIKLYQHYVYDLNRVPSQLEMLS